MFKMRLVSKNTLAANWFDELSANNVLNSYFGPLDFSITSQIINHFGKSLKKRNVENKIYKKIYSSFAEGVENAYKYQSKLNKEQPGIVFCSIVGDAVEVTIGNTISLEQKFQLTTYIDKLMTVDLEVLKKSIKADLLGLQFQTEEKSAHIGLKRILVNSNKELRYSFKELHDGALFFMVNFRIKMK
jgi:hypothetical protein